MTASHIDPSSPDFPRHATPRDFGGKGPDEEGQIAAKPERTPAFRHVPGAARKIDGAEEVALLRSILIDMARAEPPEEGVHAIRIAWGRGDDGQIRVTVTAPTALNETELAECAAKVLASFISEGLNEAQMELTREARAESASLAARLSTAEALLTECRERLWNAGFDHAACRSDDPAQRHGLIDRDAIHGRISAFLAAAPASTPATGAEGGK